MAFNSIRRLRDRLFGNIFQAQVNETPPELTNEDLKAHFTFSQKPRAPKKANRNDALLIDTSRHGAELRSTAYNNREAPSYEENLAPTIALNYKDKATSTLSVAQTISRGGKALVVEPSFTSKTSSETSDDSSEDSTSSPGHISTTDNNGPAASSSSIPDAADNEPARPRGKQSYIRPRINYGNRQGLPPDDDAWDRYHQGLHPLSQAHGMISTADMIAGVVNAQPLFSDTASDEEFDAQLAQYLAYLGEEPGNSEETTRAESSELTSQTTTQNEVESDDDADAVVQKPVEGLPDSDLAAFLLQSPEPLFPPPVAAAWERIEGLDASKPLSLPLEKLSIDSMTPIVEGQEACTASPTKPLEAISPLLHASDNIAMTGVKLPSPPESAMASNDTPAHLDSTSEIQLSGTIMSAEIAEADELPNGMGRLRLTPVDDGKVTDSAELPIEVDPALSNGVEDPQAGPENADAPEMSIQTGCTTHDEEGSLAPPIEDQAPGDSVAETTEDSTSEPAYFLRRSYRFNPYTKFSAEDNAVSTLKSQPDDDLHPAYLKVKTDLHLPGLGQPYLSASAKPVPAPATTRAAAIYVTPGERRKFTDAVHSELKRGGIVQI